MFLFQSDMYGLGIILYELFNPFRTLSERCHLIRDLKEKRTVNPDVIKRWPDLVSLFIVSKFNVEL